MACTTRVCSMEGQAATEVTPSGEPEAWEAPQGAGVPEEGALCRAGLGDRSLETVRPLGHSWALSWRQPGTGGLGGSHDLSSPQSPACGPYDCPAAAPIHGAMTFKEARTFRVVILTSVSSPIH